MVQRRDVALSREASRLCGPEYGEGNVPWPWVMTFSCPESHQRSES
jgi:hypothetical protein